MNTKEVFQWMLDNKYLYEIKGVLRVTNKFLRDSQKTSNTPSIIPKMDTLQLASAMRASDRELFIKFMEDADIPYRITTTDGGQYTVKSTSISAVKAFGGILRKIEQGKLNYMTLVYSTKLYYKNDKLYRQTILNYLTKGTWEFEYKQFEVKASQGVKEIEGHIKDGMGISKFGEDI